MTKEQLAALFATAKDAETTYTRNFDHVKPATWFVHRFYPVNQLPQLIEELKKLPDDPFDEDFKYSAKFLVTTAGQILFARQGLNSKFVPEHKDIRTSCKAAGNIFFSADFSTITRINNQSKNFSLDASSLLWPLAILAGIGAPLASPLKIELAPTHQIPHLMVFTELDLSQADLAALIPASAMLKMRAANPNAAIIVEEKTQEQRLPLGRLSVFNHAIYHVALSSVSSSDEEAAGPFSHKGLPQRLNAPAFVTDEESEGSHDEASTSSASSSGQSSPPVDAVVSRFHPHKSQRVALSPTTSIASNDAAPSSDDDLRRDVFFKGKKRALTAADETPTPPSSPASPS